MEYPVLINPSEQVATECIQDGHLELPGNDRMSQSLKDFEVLVFLVLAKANKWYATSSCKII